jgi:hypothetical protein
LKPQTAKKKKKKKVSGGRSYQAVFKYEFQVRFNLIEPITFLLQEEGQIHIELIEITKLP